jgi:hypothetical protein
MSEKTRFWLLLGLFVLSLALLYFVSSAVGNQLLIQR